MVEDEIGIISGFKPEDIFIKPDNSKTYVIHVNCLPLLCTSVGTIWEAQRYARWFSEKFKYVSSVTVSETYEGGYRVVLV